MKENNINSNTEYEFNDSNNNAGEDENKVVELENRGGERSADREMEGKGKELKSIFVKKNVKKIETIPTSFSSNISSSATISPSELFIPREFMKLVPEGGRASEKKKKREEVASNFLRGQESETEADRTLTAPNLKKRVGQGLGAGKGVRNEIETEADRALVGSNRKRRAGQGLGTGKGVENEEIETEEDRTRIESGKRRLGLSSSPNKGVEDRKERRGPSERENSRASESEGEEEAFPSRRTRKRGSASDGGHPNPTKRTEAPEEDEGEGEPDEEGGFDSSFHSRNSEVSTEGDIPDANEEGEGKLFDGHIAVTMTMHPMFDDIEH